MTLRRDRREFLQGRLSSEKTSGEAPTPGVGGVSAGGSYQLRITRRAMACDFEVLLNIGQYERGTEVALEVLDLVTALEEQLSYFRAGSELSRINALAAEVPVPVETSLFELFERCLQLGDETEGAFDMAAAALWEAWGFARRKGEIPTDEAVLEALRHVGSRFVALDRDKRTIRFLDPGVRLNLGSIGKGYALDRCAALFAEAQIEDYLIHAGKSSVLAHGKPMQDRPAETSRPWCVGVAHPLRRGQRLAELSLARGALATSGSANQFFRYRGKRYSHVIDPRTGYPAEGVLSATVIAASAAVADALSTAFFILGPEKTREFCRTRPELAALLVTPGGHAGAVDLHPIQLEPEEWRAVDAP